MNHADNGANIGQGNSSKVMIFNEQLEKAFSDKNVKKSLEVLGIPSQLSNEFFKDMIAISEQMDSLKDSGFVLDKFRESESLSFSLICSADKFTAFVKWGNLLCRLRLFYSKKNMIDSLFYAMDLDNPFQENLWRRVFETIASSGDRCLALLAKLQAHYKWHIVVFSMDGTNSRTIYRSTEIGFVKFLLKDQAELSLDETFLLYDAKEQVFHRAHPMWL